MNRAAASDDDAGAQKADTRNNLSRNPRRVQHNRLGGQHVAEPVLADQQDQRRRRAHDRLRPQPSDLALYRALQADEGRQPERDEKLHQVSTALRGAAKERVGQPDLHARQASRPAIPATCRG
jgi:hypothetical protein